MGGYKIIDLSQTFLYNAPSFWFGKIFQFYFFLLQTLKSIDGIFKKKPETNCFPDFVIDTFSMQK